MPHWTVLLLACAAAAGSAWLAVGLALRLLIRFSVYDKPTGRGSHSRPTPRGAGFALIPVVLTAWVLTAALAAPPPSGFPGVLGGALLLVLVSAWDDLRSLPQGPRFATQIVAVALGLLAMGSAGPVFQGLLPPLADRLLAGLAWLWFINLFNFMDGIDGISGVETVSVGLGLGLVAWSTGQAAGQIALPWLLAAAALGFLVWNWSPARIFLGDAGSMPLGYLLGWLLLLAAAEGQWAAALILPLYYLADATVTLLRRAARGIKFWRPHREHLYQRAVDAGLSHARMAGALAALNGLLIALALLAAGGYELPALASAALATGLFWLFLERRARSG